MTATTHTGSVLLTIGSNADNAHTRVTAACEYLRTILSDCRFSQIVTAPSYTGVGADYVNIAVIATSAHSPEALHRILRRYEDSHGRQRPTQNNTIAIDIDIIRFDDTILKPEDLTHNWLIHAVSQLCRTTSDTNVEKVLTKRS